MRWFEEDMAGQFRTLLESLDCSFHNRECRHCVYEGKLRHHTLIHVHVCVPTLHYIPMTFWSY